MAQPLQYNFYTKIILVPLPDTTLDLQFLVNETRVAEANLTPGMGYPKIMDAFGKQDLGGGVNVGITVVLLDGWRVQFAARTGPEYVSVQISGGNFVGEAGANPVAPSAFTQVTVAQSTSATISTPDSDTNLVYLVESLRSMHPAFGNVFYWDPYAGLDTNTGISPSQAVKTFAAAHSLVTSGNGDVIFCRSSDPSGSITVDETLAITKHNVKVRGPGNSVRIIPTGTTTATVAVTADNVEFSGFYLETAGTGGQNAFEVAGNNVLVRDVWVNNVQGHGLSVTGSARMRVLTSVIENCVGDSVHLGDSTSQALLSKLILDQSANGLVLSGTLVTDNVIENCLIYQNTAYGIQVGTGVERTMVRGQNTIVNNTTANTLDNGTDTYIETQAGGASASEIADSVWDEVLTSHTAAGSAGRTLKDIKTRATLASIK